VGLSSTPVRWNSVASVRLPTTFTAAGATLQFDIGTNQLGGAVHAVAGDNIDLRFQPFATGDKLVWNQPTGLLSLETSSGSVLAKLTLTGSYTQSSFTAMDDQHNGTMIKVQSAGVGRAPPMLIVGYVFAIRSERTLCAANRPRLSQNTAAKKAQGRRTKSIRTQLAIGMIRLAATLCSLALGSRPGP
jgi:hypothetical protein